MIFFRQNKSDCLKNLWKFRILVSELVEGSDEQDIFFENLIKLSDIEQTWKTNLSISCHSCYVGPSCPVPGSRSSVGETNEG